MGLGTRREYLLGGWWLLWLLYGIRGVLRGNKVGVIRGVGLLGLGSSHKKEK